MSDNLPAPLIPADVDLRDFAFTPMFRGRLFGSSFHARVSDAGWRAGVTLWLKSWDQMPAGTLPDDEIDLCRLAELGRDVKAWKKVAKEALWGWFKCADGRLHHRTVAEGVMEAWQAKQKRHAKIIRRLEMESGQWSALRSTVFARDKYACRYCGAHGRLECDHVVPLSRGGRSDLENLVTACLPCNRRKGARTLKEWLQ